MNDRYSTFKHVRGDGFVSEESQNLQNVAFFREHQEIKVRVIRVESPHLADTMQKEIIPLFFE